MKTKMTEVVTRSENNVASSQQHIFMAYAVPHSLSYLRQDTSATCALTLLFYLSHLCHLLSLTYL